MRVIVAGSRTITDPGEVEEAILWSGFKITTVISGNARGVDTSGEEYAEKHGIPVEVYPADWGKYGNGAGYRRNLQMAKVAEALLALWDGVSPGTRNMIKIAQELGLRVYVHMVTIPVTVSPSVAKCGL